jgi:exopolyphosphatase/pppGpp-phosphohydrolase
MPGTWPARNGETGHHVSATRLGVLDIGSNTGHLLVVDAARGATPIRMVRTDQFPSSAAVLPGEDEAPLTFLPVRRWLDLLAD